MNLKLLPQLSPLPVAQFVERVRVCSDQRRSPWIGSVVTGATAGDTDPAHWRRDWIVPFRRHVKPSARSVPGKVRVVSSIESAFSAIVCTACTYSSQGHLRRPAAVEFSAERKSHRAFRRSIKPSAQVPAMVAPFHVVTLHPRLKLGSMDSKR